MDSSHHARNKGERDIDLISILRYIFVGWRVGIIALVAGILLGALFGIFKNERKYCPESEEELILINDMFNRYQSCKQKATERNGGYLMTLSDDKEYYYGSSVYYISAGSDTETTLLGKILNITAESDYLYDLRDILGISDDVYINSLDMLLTASFSMQYADSGVKIYQDGDLTHYDDETGYGVLIYNFNYLERDEIELLMQYVDERISECEPEKLGVTTYTVDKLYTKILPYTENVPLKARLNVSSANVNDLNNFYCYLEELSKTENSEVDYKEVVEYFRTTYLEDQPQSCVVKFAVLGALVSFIAFCIIRVCRFIFSGYLYSEQDLSCVYGFNIIGVFRGARKKGMDLLIENVFTAKSKIYSSLDYIKDTISLFGKEKMAVATVGESEYMHSLAANLSRESNGGIIEGNILLDANILNTARENSGLIFIVSLGQSRISDFEAALDVCYAHNLKVFGIVVVDER